MERINRDAAVAIFLLVVCGIFFWASFDIRQPNYGVLMPSAWPRVIIAALTVLSLIYLVQSLKQAEKDTLTDEDAPDRDPGFMGWLMYWRNPIWCFVLFFGYLMTLPILGSLLGGIAFVFSLLTALGGWEGKKLLVHAGVAVLTIGSMWALFTFGLGVLLPTGIFMNSYG